MTDERGEPVIGLTPGRLRAPRRRRAADALDLRRRGLPAVGRGRARSQLQHGRHAAGPGEVARRGRSSASCARRTSRWCLAIGSEVEIVAPLSTDRPRAVRRAGAARRRAGRPACTTRSSASIDDVQAAKGRRALVLLSDGDDRYSKATAADALDRARRADVMIYPVALGATRPPLFAELATLTGGRSFHARDARGADRDAAHDRQRAAPAVPARLHAGAPDRCPAATSGGRSR